MNLQVTQPACLHLMLRQYSLVAEFVQIRAAHASVLDFHAVADAGDLLPIQLMQSGRYCAGLHFQADAEGCCTSIMLALPHTLFKNGHLAHQADAGVCALRRLLHLWLLPDWPKARMSDPIVHPAVMIPFFIAVFGFGPFIVPAYLAFTNPNPISPIVAFLAIFLGMTGSAINICADTYKTAQKSAGVSKVDTNIYDGERYSFYPCLSFLLSTALSHCYHCWFQEGVHHLDCWVHTAYYYDVDVSACCANLAEYVCRIRCSCSRCCIRVVEGPASLHSMPLSYMHSACLLAAYCASSAMFRYPRPLCVSNYHPHVFAMLLWHVA